jgi:ubiquinone/menaquinone biosynthesis C-methylase UbiE
MSSQVTQSEDYNFIAFSRDEAYREANRQLLREVFPRLPSAFFHVDVASGTGLVPQEMSTLCVEEGKCGTIIGVDPDRFAIENARASTPSTLYSTVEYLVGKGQDLARLLAGKIPPDGVDYVSIHDAIHEVEEEDKQSVMQAIASIIKPGGLFTYNSAFTTVAMEESAMQWGRWKAKAFSTLGGRRNRKVKGFIVHTPDEYRDMITQAGLSIIYEAKKSVIMSRNALETIAMYPRFVYGVFADYVGEQEVTLQEQSKALIQALDELGLADIPRVWHELIAQKPLLASKI